MSTFKSITSARRRVALNLGRLLMLSSVVSVVVLTQAGAASAAATNFPRWVDYPSSNRPVSVVVGDFNGDGDPDVATAGSSVGVNLGGPDGTFGPRMPTEASGDLQSIAIGDFNADDNPDLVVTDATDDTVSVLLGSPDGTFEAPTSFPVDAAPYGVAVGDFNGDDDPDLAVASLGTDAVSILLGEPGGTFGPKTSIEAGYSSPMSVAVGDFNGDSDPDLAVGDVRGDVTVLLGGPAATFDRVASYSIGSLQLDGSMKIVLGDFNGDSDPDLAVVDKSRGVWILLGASGGTFTGPTGYFLLGTADLAVGDFNDDSRSDVAVAERDGQIEVIHGKGDGTFTNLLQFSTGDTTAGVAAGDFDADDRTDLVVTKPDGGTGNGSIAVLLNNPDSTPPVTTITGGPDGVTNDNTPTFTFTSSEVGSTFECSVGGGFVPCTSPYTTDSLGDGSHTFRVRAIDAADNVDATPASRSFTIDRSPATTSITSGPSGPTGDSTPTFGFTSPDSDVTYECRVDDAAFDACPNPHTTAELDDGEHVFQVRAVDPTGNVDPNPAARAFTVDTVAPDTTISSGPSGTIGDSTPTFGWEYADGAVAHECRVDDQPFAPCESPKTTDNLSDGQHTFELRAIDLVGNTDPTPASRTFTVDTEGLVTGITSGPNGLINDSTPTFSFSTSEPDSTFECKVSGGFEPCTSPFTSPELSDGEHTFQVRSIDSLGNVESPAVGRTFTVDTTAPDTAISTGPTGTIDDQTPTFGFDSPDAGATLECRVDGADFGPCTSPYTTALLANGSHTFQARATDAAGNTDPTPASRTFTVNVDHTAPITQIDSGPADLSNQVTPTFTFSANESATFECKLDAGSFAPCDSGDSFGPLDEGSHTFAVRATDEAGNVDSTPATREWIVDTTPPDTTITSGPGSLALLSSKATFGLSSTEGGSSFQCRLDAGAWVACTSPRVYTGLKLGNHTFAVRAIDPAGNTDPTPAEATWFTLGLLSL